MPLRMKKQHDAYVAYLHILFPFVYYLLGSVQSINCPSYCYSLSAFFHYTSRISIRTIANLYKCLAITTNVLPLIRMACDCFPICCQKCVFTNFRNVFLKFAKPRERPGMLTNTNECKAITMRPLQFVSELP